MKLASFTSAFALSALTLTASPVAAADASIAYDTPAAYDVQATYRWGKNVIDALAEAGFETTEFPANSIGGEEERFDQLRSGLLSLNMGNFALGMQMVPEMTVLSIPFLIDNMEHFQAFLEESDFLDFVNTQMEGTGARVLAVVPLAGMVGIFNDEHAVSTPADLEGIRIRALDSAQLGLIESMGADGVVIPFSEVPSALQTGVADGYLNPINVPLTFGHGDLLNYFTDAGILFAPRLALASEDWWNGLSEDEKAAVDAAVDAANADLMSWAENANDMEEEKLLEAGFEITKLTPEEKQAFRDATASYREGLDIDGIDALIEAAEASRR